MTIGNDQLSVKIEQDLVTVIYSSEIDGSPYQESIRLQDVVKVLAERSEIGGERIIHWFLQHREGWTLHFNDEFIGASSAIQEIGGVLGFCIPNGSSIAGAGSEGTLVWQAT